MPLQECLGDGVTDAEKQEEYEAAWDGSVVYESDMQCNMTAHLFCGEGDAPAKIWELVWRRCTDGADCLPLNSLAGKVKEGYTKCSSQFCDVMRDDSEAGKNALECEEDADCNVRFMPRPWLSTAMRLLRVLYQRNDVYRMHTRLMEQRKSRREFALRSSKTD